MTDQSKKVPDASNDAAQEMKRATSEESDAPLDSSITSILRLVREHLAMDSVFVAHYAGDLNVFTHADTGSVERTWLRQFFYRMDRSTAHFAASALSRVPT